MNKVRRDILQTFSGKVIDIDAPSPNSICIEDIARGLANIKRFSGQADCSVALHSLNASTAAFVKGFSPRRQLYALLHDAAEAYYGDVPSPIKNRIKTYKTLENKLLNIILEKYLKEPNLAKMPKWLKFIDDELLSLERDLFFDKKLLKIATKHYPNFLRTAVSHRCQFINHFNHLYRQIYLEGDTNVRTEKLGN